MTGLRLSYATITSSESTATFCAPTAPRTFTATEINPQTAFADTAIVPSVSGVQPRASPKRFRPIESPRVSFRPDRDYSSPIPTYRSSIGSCEPTEAPRDIQRDLGPSRDTKLLSESRTFRIEVLGRFDHELVKVWTAESRERPDASFFSCGMQDLLRVSREPGARI